MAAPNRGARGGCELGWRLLEHDVERHRPGHAGKEEKACMVLGASLGLFGVADDRGTVAAKISTPGHVLFAVLTALACVVDSECDFSWLRIFVVGIFRWLPWAAAEFPWLRARFCLAFFARAITGLRYTAFGDEWLDPHVMAYWINIFLNMCIPLVRFYVERGRVPECIHDIV